jgi:hypothetical protein
LLDFSGKQNEGHPQISHPRFFKLLASTLEQLHENIKGRPKPALQSSMVYVVTSKQTNDDLVCSCYCPLQFLCVHVCICCRIFVGGVIILFLHAFMNASYVYAVPKVLHDYDKYVKCGSNNCLLLLPSWKHKSLAYIYSLCMLKIFYACVLLQRFPNTTIPRYH